MPSHEEPSLRCPQCQSLEVDVAQADTAQVCLNCGHRFQTANAQAALRIFLSYGHDHNEELVVRMKADLQGRGHQVWFDKSHIKSGRDWRRAIMEGLLRTQRVLFVLSKHSAREPGVCLDEIAIAIGVTGGNIIPVLVENEQDVQPPQSISHIQWLDMQDWQARKVANPLAWSEWYRGKIEEILEVVESQESQRFHGEIRVLERRLNPLKFEARTGPLLERGFVGRDWLLDAVERWRVADWRRNRLFWITGPPGVGKSALAAYLAHYGKHKVIAVHFCEYDKPDHQKAEDIIRTLAFQIASRLPDYRRLLLESPDLNEALSKNAAELFESLLARPLRLVIRGGRERYLVVIDALDEASLGGRNEIAELLAHNASRLPEWLGIVVTGRPESDVTTVLQGLEPTVLDTATEDNLADIRRFLQDELAEQLQNRANSEQLLDDIIDQSEGLFLYVEQFCEGVFSGQISLDRPHQFPRGLGGMLLQFFRRQFPDPVQYDESIRPVLEVILAAREPLSLGLLKRMFGWSEASCRQRLDRLGSLFSTIKTADDVIVKPYHKSLNDWLCDEARASGDYWIDRDQGTRKLTDFCVRMAQTPEAASCSYVSQHTAAHLLAAQRWHDLVEAVAWPHLDLLNRWTARGEQREGEVCLRRAIAYLQQSGEEPNRWAELATQLARVLIQLGKHAEARSHLNQAIQCANGAPQKLTQAIALHELGSLEIYHGNLRQATRLYRRALRSARKVSPIQNGELAANLVGLATIARVNQKHRQAIRLAGSAIEHAQECSDVRHVVAGRRVRAGSLRHLMKFDAAREDLTTAKMLCVLHKLPFDQTQIMLSQAWIAYETGLLEDSPEAAAAAAEPLFTAAMNQAEQLHHQVSRLEALLGLVWCANLRLAFCEAEGWLSRVTTLPNSDQYKDVVAASHVARASVTLLDQEFTMAEQQFEAARQFSADQRLATFQADACVGLFAARHHQGQHRLAGADQRNAMKLAKSCSPLKMELIQRGLRHVKRTPGAAPF